MSEASQAVPGNKRWWLWLPLLGVGAWLALFGDKSPVTGVALSLPTNARSASESGITATEQTETSLAVAAASPLALQSRAQLFGKTTETVAADKPARRDLFATRTWNPPPPSPPPSASAISPAAPPLPFTFVGKKLEDDTWEVYLARGEQAYIAREGQVLESHWRVDKIAPPSLSFVYVPLGQVQSLSIGDIR